ncbi:MAG TPA: GIY-YIG nuclease family protein, partial [Longimicrobiaceae bacterium]
SNIGSFGEHVFKIGMTRRLDPMDRIRELGDASVPFQFDVHAIIYCDDAPALENALHRTFARRRVNLVNERKEFFNVAVQDIAAAVRQHHGELELTLLAEAQEYRKTLAIRADRERSIPQPVGGGYSVPVQVPLPQSLFGSEPAVVTPAEA